MSDPKRILVLEDDPIQRGVFERILRTGPFQVKTIHDPVELVAKLDVVPVPDAILLDILLPGMDGVTVMQHLESNARWCVVPVIMTTASPTRDRVIAANQLPVPPEALLVKPVDPQAMIQLLQAVIAGHEPLYLMRSLQRQRRSLRLSLRTSLSELEVI
jgi:two-component system alkaline phosphatase synthesis response regulator PhoP